MDLPEGYSARPAVLADAEEAANVIAACQVDETGKSDMTTEELISDWQTIDLADDAVVIIGPEGRIAALGDVQNRRYVRVSFYGYVHPHHRERGLGTFLVRHAEAWISNRLERAPRGVQVVLEFYANGANTSAEDLLENLGYPRVRTVYVMEIDLAGDPPVPQWPPGIEVRPYIPGQDEQTLFEVGETAFPDSWSHPPGTLEGWTRATRSDVFDSSLWFLALDRDSHGAAGLCLGTAVAGRGWINTLGVRPEYRRKGLAFALLMHAFGAYFQRGITNVGLSVDADSPTGAPRLYSRAGMVVVQRYHVYRREIRAGTDFAHWSGEEL